MAVVQRSFLLLVVGESVVFAELSRGGTFDLAEDGGKLSNALETKHVCNLGYGVIFGHKHLLCTAHQQTGDVLRRRDSGDALERLAEPRIAHSEAGCYILGTKGVVYLLAHELARLVDDIFGASCALAIAFTFVENMPEHVCYNARQKLLAAYSLLVGNSDGIAVQRDERIT